MEGEASQELEGCMPLGPWGNPNGTCWSYKFNDGAILRRIIVRHHDVIGSIVFETVDANGEVTFSNRFGGNVVPSGASLTTTKVDIDGPKEYLQKISGTCGYEKWHPFLEKKRAVKSLIFHTNLNNYEVNGPVNDADFSVNIKGSIVVGFHGRGLCFIDAIGVYGKPYREEVKVKHILIIDKYEEVKNVVRVLGPRALGIWGGPGGKPWDDGVFAAVKQVRLYKANGMITGIRCQYRKHSGESVHSEIHGSGVAVEIIIHQINLDSGASRDEYLVSVEGYHGPFEGNDFIKSLTFYTNKGRYGPFGTEIGVYFASSSGGKIVGFGGRSSNHLDALGVHVEYP